MNLSDIRVHIDHIDKELLKLLHQRLEYSLRAGKLKETISDPAREAKILDQLQSSASPPLESELIGSLYRLILSESRHLQEKRLKLVAFQGEHGAWSEMAIRKLSDEWVSIPCSEFAEVFSAVSCGETDCGVVPVENSLEGAVTEVSDMLVETDLKITAEVILPVRQCLLALPGSDYREIKVVYSHPQALAQCRAFLARNRLEPRPFYDTAGAARWLSREKASSAGVIASRLAAQIYDLEIIKENIEDSPKNTTRFVMLSRQENDDQGGNKCSLIFTTQHRAGALYEVLRIFAGKSINLTRIESRPSRQSPGTFAFLLDFQGSRSDTTVAAALGELSRTVVTWKNLGFYAETAP